MVRYLLMTFLVGGLALIGCNGETPTAPDTGTEQPMPPPPEPDREVGDTLPPDEPEVGEAVPPDDPEHPPVIEHGGPGAPGTREGPTVR